MNCRDMEPVLACFDDGAGTLTTVVAHYEYALDATNLPYIVATRYTDANGAIFDTSAGTVTAGACSVGGGFGPDVEWEVLCDVEGAEAVQFMCRTLTTFNPDGTINTQTVDNFEMDKTTAYTPGGADGVQVCGPAVCDTPAEGGVQLVWGSSAN